MEDVITTMQNLQFLTAVKDGHVGRIKSLLDKGNSPNGGFDTANPLYQAIEADHVKAVSLLIERGANVNAPIEQAKNQTALHRAVMRGNKAIVSAILQHSADWKATDSDGATVLHLAMESKKQEEIIDILKIFLDLGADSNAKTTNGETPLFVAVKYKMQEVAKFLAERGADLNVQTRDGETALFAAIKYRMPEVAKHLVEHGADVNMTTTEGETPLLAAGKYRMRDVVKFLIERGADANARDCQGDSLLHYLLRDLNSPRSERPDKHLLVEWLLSQGADANRPNVAGKTPLQLAVRSTSRDAVECLLPRVGDLHGYRDDDRGRTILHAVLELSVRDRADPESPEPAKVQQIERMVDSLLEKGLSVDATDAEGNTAFHTAVKEKKWFAVPKLLARFADVNARNARGQTPLHIAVDFGDHSYPEGYLEAVETLVARGTNVEMQSDEGLSAVQLAAKNEHPRILEFFKGKGADFKVKTAKGESLLHLCVGVQRKGNRGGSDCSGILEMLIDEGHCAVNAATVDGLTALHVALEARNMSAAKTLIERGADVDARDSRTHSTPLLVAARRCDRQTIEALIEAGADVNAEDAAGKTALHFAVEHEADAVKILLRAGAYCDVVDSCGFTPLYYALKLDNYEATAYLLEAGADLNGIGVGKRLHQLRERERIRRCLVKLALAQLPIAEVFGSPSAYLRGDGFRGESIFRDNCRREVKKIKSVRVDGERTLYDFLHLSIERKINWLSYDKLSEIVQVSNLIKYFPLYCDVILGQYLQAVERTTLLDRGRVALERIVGFAMPDLCVENIFGRLCNRSLKLMIKAVDLGVGKRERILEGDEKVVKRQRME